MVSVAFILLDHKSGTFIIGLVIGGLLSFMGLLLAVCFWADDGRVLRRLAAFRRGEYLAHWTYTPEEWKACEESLKSESTIREVYIGRDCVLCGSTLIRWNVIGQSLASVVLVAGQPNQIKFVVSNVNSNGAAWLNDISIPIPPGQESRAEEVVKTVIAAVRPVGCGVKMFWIFLAIVSLALVGLQLASTFGILK